MCAHEPGTFDLDRTTNRRSHRIGSPLAILEAQRAHGVNQVPTLGERLTTSATSLSRPL